MLSTWLPILPAVMVECLLFYVPGLLATLGWRLPVLWRVGLAPVVTMLILGISGFAAWSGGGTWSVWWVLGTTVAVAGIAWVLALVGRRTRVGSLWLMRDTEHVPGFRELGQYGLGLIAPLVLLAPRYLSALGSPSNFLQRFDNAFHLNAIAWIVNTGEAFSPQLSFMVNSSIYPLGWHQMNALTEMVSGVSLTGTVLASYLVVMFVVWPISVAVLAESSLRMTFPVRLLTPSVSLAFMAFPHMTVDAGGIYSNYLGLGLAPVVLACLIQLAQVSEAQQLDVWTAGVMAMAGALGLAWAHPNATMFVAAAAVPLVAVSVWLRFRSSTPASDGDVAISARAWLIVGLIYTLLLAVAWVVLAPGLDVAPWLAFESIPQAVGEAFFTTTMSKQAIWTGSFLTIAGFVVVVNRRRDLAWVLGPFIVAAGLYLVSASFGPGLVRNLITGVFYNDARRTGSAMAIGVLPMALIAVRALVDWLCETIAPRWGVTRRVWRRPLVLGLLVSLVTAGSVSLNRGFVVNMGNVRAAHQYQQKGDYSVLSRTELALLREAAKQVPTDEVIAKNPLDGSGLMYAMAGATPLNYYMFQRRTDEIEYLNKRLRRAATDPKVCEIARGLRVTHVVVLGEDMIGGYDPREDYEGMLVHPFTKGFTLETQIGSAMLYRISACD